MFRVKNLELINSKIVDFELAPGEVLSVRGENGAGKSLMLKTLARLISKKSGEIYLDDKNSVDFEVTLWRSKVMYLPPVVTFEEDQTVEEFLRHPLQFKQYHHFKQSFFPEKYIEDLSRKMSLLSSGQRQQVALLRALSLNPQILLLDESFSHMDQARRKSYIQILSVEAQKGLAIMSVSHDPLDFEGLRESKLTL